MFDFIRGLFKKEFQLNHISEIGLHLHNIIELFDKEYTAEGTSKNAAIDAVCKLLQEYKDPEPQGKQNA